MKMILFLKARGHKYISKKWKGDHWEYEYWKPKQQRKLSSKIEEFFPGKPVKGSLNGIPFDDKKPERFEWLKDEPPIKQVPGKRISAGVIMVEPDHRVWVVSPSGGFGGYKNTFPKGGVKESTPQKTAIREVWEESGLVARITRVLGDYERTTSVTRYYIGERIGGSPEYAGWESEKVSLVPLNQLENFMDSSIDKQIARDLKETV